MQLSHRPYIYGEVKLSGRAGWEVTLHNDGPGTGTEIACRLVFPTVTTEWSPPIAAMQPGEITPPSHRNGQGEGFWFAHPSDEPRGVAPSVEVQFGSITGARWRMFTGRSLPTPFVAHRLRSGRLDLWRPRG